MALMISISGIRGIFGTDLTPENLTRFTAAYGTWINRGTVVVGRDTRVTGQLCEDVVTSALQSVGCDVIKAGVVPTPTVEMGILKHEADGGIVISASHNSAEWNALKLLNQNGEFLNEEEGNAILNIAEQKSFAYQPYDKIGSVIEDTDMLGYHITKILDLPYIEPDTIKKADFSIALDAVNGTGGIAVPALLNRLGVNKIHQLNCEPDGRFAHDPEPVPRNLSEIQEFTQNHHCDLGLVTDPDADRLALLTDEGELFGEEYTQAAAFDFMMEQKPGASATNLSSSRVVDDVVARYDQTCYRTPVGEINVVNTMKEKQAVIGGEGNGGVINPDLHYGRDALVGTAMILQLLVNRNQSSSAYRRTLPDYVIIKDKIDLGELDADALLDKVAEEFNNFNPNTLDGVKIDFEEGWVHLRKSNTEPVIRIYAEAKTEDQARELTTSVTQRAGL